jgi:hypothetical protein
MGFFVVVEVACGKYYGHERNYEHDVVVAETGYVRETCCSGDCDDRQYCYDEVVAKEIETERLT